MLEGVGYLTILGDAGKPSKIMAYKCASGGKRPSSALYMPDEDLSDMNAVPMMIDQVGEGNRLTIGEGVETTLAALLGCYSLDLATRFASRPMKRPCVIGAPPIWNIIRRKLFYFGAV